MRFSTTTSLVLALAGSALAVPGVSPASVEQKADPGSSFEIVKNVTTPEIPPKPDVVLLVDVTGSMGGSIANIKTNLANVITEVTSSQPDAQFAVAKFGDIDDPTPFQVLEGLTADGAALQAAVNALSAGGGGDFPEDWINGLYELTHGGVTFRDGGSRVIVVVGDAPSHDPSGGHALADVITDLQALSVRVIGVNVGGLDVSGQASSVTSATGGVIVGTGADAVSEAIVNGLKNLDATVSSKVISCDTGISVTFDPTEIKVPSGGTATFKETVNVAPDAPQGSTISCVVDFLINGAPGGEGFTQSVNVPVNDITPPTVDCPEGPNPAGSTTPNVNANFWTLTAVDNVDKEMTVLVRDSVSGKEFGPYPSGTDIKCIQARGAPPNVKPGTGEVEYKITVNGCCVLVARDAAGNEATKECCARPH